MIRIVGVKFTGNAKVYSFDAKNALLEVGDGVIVETVKGLEYGTVAEAVREANEESVKYELKPVVRKATERDAERVSRNLALKPNAMKVAAEKIEKHALPMKLVDCEYTFDGGKLIFYFTSDNRVDFRDLVKDLASYFRVRIELRQIGIRDECKMLGGVAPCGRACCCSAFLGEFAHVTVKMAKNQGLSLNPTKISGLCGRLMCCLQYENEHYVETAKKMPKQNSEVQTPAGTGVVLSNNMLKEEIRVRVASKDGYEIKDYRLDEISFGTHVATAVPRTDDDDFGEVVADSEWTEKLASYSDPSLRESAEPDSPVQARPSRERRDGDRRRNDRPARDGAPRGERNHGNRPPRDGKIGENAPCDNNRNRENDRPRVERDGNRNNGNRRPRPGNRNVQGENKPKPQDHREGASAREGEPKPRYRGGRNRRGGRPQGEGKSAPPSDKQ